MDGTEDDRRTWAFTEFLRVGCSVTRLHAVFSRRIMNFRGESLAERKRNLDKWQSGQMKVMSHDFLYISKVSLKNWGPLLSPMKDTPATWNDMLGPPWYKKSEDPSGG